VTENKLDGQVSIPGKEEITLLPGLLEVKWTECEADYLLSCNKLRFGTDVLPFRNTFHGIVLNKEQYHLAAFWNESGLFSHTFPNFK